MEKKKLDMIVQKYLQLKPLSDNDAIAARREYVRRELEHWQDIFTNGCSDPAWPDGCNLNLTRNHILSALRSLRDLGEDTSGEYIPPEVENGLMIPTGRWFKVRFERFKQAGQHVQIASTEISLF
ncbi:hypothetical protein [Selenomonas bovis]|uniref:hypothetical protein n=1 Tax=Selenomonas bovis TaxID=416586 RepID=UPI003AB9234A